MSEQFIGLHGTNWHKLHVACLLSFSQATLVLDSLVVFCGCTESDLMLNCLLPSFGPCNSCFSVVFGTLPVKWTQISEWSPGFAESHAKSCMFLNQPSDIQLERQFCVRWTRKLAAVRSSAVQWWHSENFSLPGSATSVNFGPGWVA